MQLTLCVCEDWTNECYDNDIGQLKQCKDNEVCYFKKWSVGFISSYGSFERRSCEPRENHRINFCGKDDFWMKDEVVYDSSMTSLFVHKVAQPSKWRFLPKNLSQLVIFVIGLAFI